MEVHLLQPFDGMMPPPDRRGVQGAASRVAGRQLLRLILIFVSLICVTGCADILGSLGNPPATARANADALLFSLASRFGPVQPAPGYEEIRSKLSASAAIPSRLYGDTALWSTVDGNVRELVLIGRALPGGYLLGERRSNAPREPGDYRRSTRLRALGDGQFEWRVRDELAVGTISGRQMRAALKELFEAAELNDARSVRTIYERNLPRTTRGLGRLLELDSISLTPAVGGGTMIFLSVRSHPGRISGSFPNLSHFLRRYGSPLRAEITAEDGGGSRWWIADIDRDRATIRLRVQGGRIVPLTGTPRPMPERILVRASASTRVRIFDVGASGLQANVVIHRDPDQPGFTAHFREEPEWQFPLLVERIIRSSLRRPFAGEGASLDMRVNRSDGRTTFVREYRMTVQESAIVRWLGGLGSSTLDDFRKGAEQEYDRFVAEFYNALRQDLNTILR